MNVGIASEGKSPDRLEIRLKLLTAFLALIAAGLTAYSTVATVQKRDAQTQVTDQQESLTQLRTENEQLALQLESATARIEELEQQISATSTDGSTPDVPSAGTVFIADLEDESFVQEPLTATRGEAVINQARYSSSYFWVFNNCTSCTEDSEFKVTPGYQRLVGTVGLTDDTRTDDPYDGAVTFTIYDTSNTPIFGPVRIEYPNTEEVDVTIPSTPRLRLSVSEGGNQEYPCWCSLRLER